MENPVRFKLPVPAKIRDVLAVGLFVILAGYVTFSGFRLALLLWQRFG
ncbi:MULTISPECIES: hypothetical protein [unclassified Synechococcus]|jgi:hypothetical protein|nr:MULTISPECIES: hypothetical protein [unclassified Synechococcus]QNG25962.1 hypothetical protein H0O21_00510 [Synechococcus sp. HK01-R]